MAVSMAAMMVQRRAVERVWLLVDGKDSQKEI
jgi:hypothetical protein